MSNADTTKAPTKLWLAFDIGCIECEEPSSVIGVFTTEQAAKDACTKEREIQEKNWTGQHSMQVFEITLPVFLNIPPAPFPTL